MSISPRGSHGLGPNGPRRVPPPSPARPADPPRILVCGDVITDLLARLFDGGAALHLTGYTFSEPSLLEVALWLLGQARARALAVTIDPGSAAFLDRMGPAAFLRWTEGAAVCFPNRDEAAVLTGETEPLV